MDTNITIVHLGGWNFIYSTTFKYTQLPAKKMHSTTYLKELGGMERPVKTLGTA
jgi:hypothetical protein